MKITQKLLAAVMAAVMLLTAAPLAGLNLTAEAKSSVSQSHKHKKVASVKKATSKNNGLKTVKCSSCKKTLSKTTIYKIASVKLKKTSYSYTGKAIKPTVVVKDSKGKTLKNKTDYTVSYKNNKAAGKATVTVTFKGNYSGSKTLTFSILPKLKTSSTDTSVSASWTKVSGAKSYKVALYKGSKAVKTVTTKKTSAKFTSLSTSTSYSVRLTALNGKKTVATAKATVKTLSKNSVPAYRVKAFNATISAGTYKMTFTTNDKTLGDAPITMAVKGGNVCVETEIEGMKCKMLMLKKNGKTYLIIDKMRSYCEMPKSMLDDGLDIGQIADFEKPAGSITAKKVKQGKKTLVCESYKLKSGDKVNFYFNGNVPVKRESIDSNNVKTVMEFSEFTTDVSDSYFKLPTLYFKVPSSILENI